MMSARTVSCGSFLSLVLWTRAQSGPTDPFAVNAIFLQPVLNAYIDYCEGNESGENIFLIINFYLKEKFIDNKFLKSEISP